MANPFGDAPVNNFGDAPILKENTKTRIPSVSLPKTPEEKLLTPSVENIETIDPEFKGQYPNALYTEANPTNDLAMALQGIYGLGKLGVAVAKNPSIVPETAKAVYAGVKAIPAAVKSGINKFGDMVASLTAEAPKPSLAPAAKAGISELNLINEGVKEVPDVIPATQTQLPFSVENTPKPTVKLEQFKTARKSPTGEVITGHGGGEEITRMQIEADKLEKAGNLGKAEELRSTAKDLRKKFIESKGFTDIKGEFKTPEQVVPLLEDGPAASEAFNVERPFASTKSGITELPPVDKSKVIKFSEEDLKEINAAGANLPVADEEQKLLRGMSKVAKGKPTEPFETKEPGFDAIHPSVKKPVNELVDNWDGHKAVIAHDAAQMQAALSGSIPESRAVILREVVENGKAPTKEALEEAAKVMEDKAAFATDKLIRERALYTAKQLREAAASDLNLTPAEQELVGKIKPLYEAELNQAQKAGVIKGEVEDYFGPQMFIPEEKNVGQGMLGGTPFAKERKVGSTLDKIIEGRVPRTLDLGDQVKAYHVSVGTAINNKNLVSGLKEAKLLNYDGEGVRLNSPVFRRGFVMKGKPVVQDAYADPETAKVLNNLTDPGFLYKHEWLQKMSNIGQWLKMWKLTLSTFHFKALAVESIAKGMSPLGYLDGLKLVESQPELYRDMLRAGLTSGDAKSFGAALMDINGKIEPKGMLEGVRQVFDTALWDRYYKGLKVAATNIGTRRYIARGIAPDRALELAAADANTTFGGLNLTRIGRSKEVQEAFKTIFLAPDWTEAKIRQAIVLSGRGTGAITPQEIAAVRAEAMAFWARMGVYLIGSAVARTVLGNIVPGAKEAGTKDIIKLFTTPDRYITTKLAPIPKANLDVITGKPFQALLDIAPIPIQAVQLVNAFNPWKKPPKE